MIGFLINVYSYNNPLNQVRDIRFCPDTGEIESRIPITAFLYISDEVASGKNVARFYLGLKITLTGMHLAIPDHTY